MARLWWVCLAGGLGTGARYLVVLVATRSFGTFFPWGTLAVNVVGCFLMSFVAYAGAQAAISPATRTVLATGFLGGLTTYSSFNWETLVFVRNASLAMGLLNVVATLVGCGIAGVLGLGLARAVFGG